MVAAAMIGSAVVGAGASMYSANKAASSQKNAATRASDTQRQMFDITREGLAPYNIAGQNAVDILNNRIGDFSRMIDVTPTEVPNPVVMDQATLESTPGYQFNRSQGLKAAQNSASARGLGTSGAAYKGAINFATGLADSTYQNQFANAVTNQQNQFGNRVTSGQNYFQNQIANQTNSYNRLLQLAGLGENAAAGTGTAATATGASIGGNMVGAGDAAAAGYNKIGGALGQAAQSVPNAMLTNQFLKNGIYGNGGGWQNPDRYVNQGNQLISGTNWGPA